MLYPGAHNNAIISPFGEIVKISVLAEIYIKTVALRARNSRNFYFSAALAYSFWRFAPKEGVDFLAKTVRHTSLKS